MYSNHTNHEDTSNIHVWHDSSRQVTWAIHMCNMVHWSSRAIGWRPNYSHIIRLHLNSYVYTPWIDIICTHINVHTHIYIYIYIYTCMYSHHAYATSNIYVWHDSWLQVTSTIHMCDMMHWSSPARESRPIDSHHTYKCTYTNIYVYVYTRSINIYSHIMQVNVQIHMCIRLGCISHGYN